MVENGRGRQCKAGAPEGEMAGGAPGRALQHVNRRTPGKFRCRPAGRRQRYAGNAMGNVAAAQRNVVSGNARKCERHKRGNEENEQNRVAGGDQPAQGEGARRVQRTMMSTRSMLAGNATRISKPKSVNGGNMCGNRSVVCKGNGSERPNERVCKGTVGRWQVVGVWGRQVVGSGGVGRGRRCGR